MVEYTLHMHVSVVIVQNFGTKFFLRRGECETRENSNLWKKRQNRNFDQKSKIYSLDLG